MKDRISDVELTPGFQAVLEASATIDERASGSFIYKKFVKRGLDILLTLMAAPVVVPMVFFATVIVALSGGKPFYSQPRVGLNGKTFRMWKIRSMVVDADAVLADYLAQNPEMKAEWDTKQKLENDPRITRFGKLIRKTSLDELPQLWNVFIGDMTLVGPRPMMVDQQELYPGKAYFRLRPGLTGPWQVSDRNESSFSSRAVFDAVYEHELSFRKDFGIILKTFLVVVRGTGK